MTSPAREIEFKFAVDSKQAFEHLLDYLGLPGSALNHGVTQTNHFFDSPTYCLHKHHFVIRLREQNNSYTLTIKGEQEAAAGTSSVLTDRFEAEVTLSQQSARTLLEGSTTPQQVIIDHFRDRSPALLSMIEAACAQQRLVHIGEFRNIRIHLPPVTLPSDSISENLQFELDTSHFPDGKTEYEFEIEISEHSDASAIEAALTELFHKAGIEWHSAPSKAERFFAALEKA
jgi:uncharacterized protein YjbK